MAKGATHWRAWAALLGLLGVVGVLLVVLSVGSTPKRTAVPVTPRAVEVEPAIEPATPQADDADQPLEAQFLTGYVPDPDASREFVRQLPKPTLREAAPHFFAARGPPTVRAAATSAREPVLLYPALLDAWRAKYGREWVCGKQQIGDCVSWGWGHGADIHLAVLWRLGLTGQWDHAATEAIYGGSRVEARGRSFGGWSDGSYGSAAAKWVRDWGIVYRRHYAELPVDLSAYSGRRAKDWGAYGCGGQGDGGRLDGLARAHPIKQVALVTTFDEAAEAIANGYPIPVCSGQGFSSTRDRDGFSRASGSWAHCMCFIGVRFDRPGLLCLNSWGPNWVRGPKWPTGEGYSPGNPRGPPPAQPDGSFWVDASIVNRMLGGRDSYAVSGYVGFPARSLRHSEGW